MVGGERARSGSHGGITGGGGRGPMPGFGGDRALPATLGEAMRAARRQWASGVAVVITRDAEGYRGATVSAFAVVSLEPPTVLVCLDRGGRMAAAVPEAGAFGVSVLGRDQEFAAERFAGRAPLPDAKLTGVPHRLGATGCPVLVGSLASFDCAVTATHDGGDHVIVVGAVVAAALGEESEDPLLSYGGSYRGLEPA